MPITFTNGFSITSNPNINIKDGTTAQRAGDSAYQIKTDFPASNDGLYWIKNPNINSGSAFQIYADMTTAGGGWTLIMQNNYTGWTESEGLLKHQTTPPTILGTGTYVDDTQNYSIIGWADYIKSSPSNFEYMFDAYHRGQYGGIWRANENYSFTGSVDLAQYQASGSSYFGRPTFNDIISGSFGFRQNITEIQKFPASVTHHTIDAVQIGTPGSGGNSDIIIDSTIYPDILNVPTDGSAKITSNTFFGTGSINSNYDPFNNGRIYIRFENEPSIQFSNGSSTFHITWDTITNWDYNNNGIESRMPWYSVSSAYKVSGAIITTTHDDGGSWWGTLITDGGWNPAPWQNDVGMDGPGIIWYWVR